jgi:hypothetical protein
LVELLKGASRGSEIIDRPLPGTMLLH